MKAWWQRAKARIRRLGVWKWRSPLPKALQAKRIAAKRGRSYTRPVFYAEEEP